MAEFQLKSEFQPRGDQQQAIDKLASAFRNGSEHQTLLGVTGSGKTFTMANLIVELGKPTLVMSHNKTLAAQLYGELKSFFPQNAVEFFISYYDYYQPEAYLPSSDTYIEKETSINDEIDRLRLRATSSLLERDDVIIIASVSCIYSLGSPKDYRELLLFLEKGGEYPRDELLGKLVDMYYARNDAGFPRGTFRVRGDLIEIHPAYEEEALRLEFWGDKLERISRVSLVTGELIEEKDKTAVYPAKHFVTTMPGLREAAKVISKELDERLIELRRENKLLEAQRLEQRTKYDLEMMREVGYCSGIENYSRHLSAREAGERPATLIDYFPDDYLMIVDESHVSVPQIRGMYNGDRSRKQVLVEHGFRLPSALDNRPLVFDEWEGIINQVLFVSATPGDYELEKCSGEIVQQIIRPTGLKDPEIIVRPIEGQIDDLIDEIRTVVDRKERVLVTTLTKRMSEDLTEYLDGVGIKVRYLHSEINSLERIEILRDLRLGEFDVLVGINLLREGLDLPEVSLVAILDADKEGFLRSERSLMQTSGRAARNAAGKVIFYADNMTESMRKVIEESQRRRNVQAEYNRKHGITPQTIRKSVEEILKATTAADARSTQASESKRLISQARQDLLTQLEFEEIIERLDKEMIRAAEALEFERAAQLRDEISKLKEERIPK
ncbi:excinuclease ABC subunit B [candidate division LCP-89 bacterium B3_LCP]|uniref:UvrABC system protein B n=1 Tax=candidate division LCP-89 bacterium B3_LCP TaxID=2012998 RepID=A0A532V3D8_UNCL8|nr:MAG: excinuclease ABC subunit B [candidate division LCP-89 bacterium B3_LCP]